MASEIKVKTAVPRHCRNSNDGPLVQIKFIHPEHGIIQGTVYSSELFEALRVRGLLKAGKKARR